MARKTKAKRGASAHAQGAPLHYATYTRVSTHEQGERGTPQLQVDANAAFAEANGLTLSGDEFADEVSGAVRFDEREGGAALLEAARDERRAFDGVLIFALDRLGRDAVETLLAERMLRTLALEVRFVRESFDDSPSGDFQKTVMSAVAELERSLITERLSSGRRKAVRDNGAYLGSRAPYGYTRGDDLKLRIDKEQAEVVRRIFAMVTEQDMGSNAIATALSAEGISAPGARDDIPMSQRPRFGGWNQGTVSRILRRRAYIGEATYGGKRPNKRGIISEPVKMASPLIIDVETFEAAQVASAGRRNDKLARPALRPYPLTGFMFCRICDEQREQLRAQGRVVDERSGRYIGYTRRGRAGVLHPKYLCGTARTQGAAATEHAGYAWRIDAEAAERAVTAAVEELWADPERFNARVEAHIEGLAANSKARGTTSSRPRRTYTPTRWRRAADATTAWIASRVSINDYRTDSRSDSGHAQILISASTL